MIRWLALFLSLLLAPCAALATQGAYLSADALESLEPAFEAFLEAMADALIAEALLPETEREDWIAYQLGDYLQNGGYGTIAILYSPDLLSIADPSVMVGRLSVQTEAGTLWLETLRQYSYSYSPLPGLPLDTDLLNDDGVSLVCRFRWLSTGGSFLIWDGSVGEAIDVGATYICDGRPLYWYEDPADGLAETLTLEILHATEDRKLAEVTLTVRAESSYWIPEGLE